VIVLQASVVVSECGLSVLRVSSGVLSLTQPPPPSSLLCIIWCFVQHQLVLHRTWQIPPAYFDSRKPIGTKTKLCVYGIVLASRNYIDKISDRVSRAESIDKVIVVWASCLWCARDQTDQTIHIFLVVFKLLVQTWPDPSHRQQIFCNNNSNGSCTNSSNYSSIHTNDAYVIFRISRAYHTPIYHTSKILTRFHA